MRKFLKPTKAKVIITILLFMASAFYYAFFFLSFFGITLINWCLPTIPGIDGGPTPTPELFSVSKTISDVPLLENPLPLGNYGDVMCMSDSSAQVAGYIVDISKVLAVILYVFLLYVIVSTIIFLATGSGKKTSKTKK